MDEFKDRVDEKLKSYANSKEKFSESDIAGSLKALTKDIQGETIPISVLADILAFEFSENYQDKLDGWGLFFGPHITYRNEKGNIIEFPSLSQITPEIIEFWESRTRGFFHPIIMARYNLLIWEFNKIVKVRNPSYFFALTAIDNMVSIVEGNSYSRSINLFKKLEYALSLALQLNNSERTKTVCETIMWFENEIAEDDKPGLWGYSFDLLVDNKKLSLPDNLRDEIIENAEERLKRLSSKSGARNINPWAIEKASIQLANYYRRHEKKDEVRRVLLILQQAFDSICAGAAAIQNSIWQQNIYRYFKEYGLIAEANEIAIRLQGIGPQIIKGLKKISQGVEIPKQEMGNFLTQFTDVDIDEAFTRIAVHFIPKTSDVEKLLDDLFELSPLPFIIDTQIVDRYGIPIATIGSIEDDRIGNVIRQMSQNLNISAIFLNASLGEVIKKNLLSSKDVLDYLYGSPAFTEVKKPFIELGLKYYFQESYINCIHILVPQIEDIIRTIIDLAGGSILKPVRTGGFNYKILDELLRDDVFLNIFGENVCFYLRVLLTDKRGWNIRNNLCHGLIHFEMLNQHIADRLIHTMLLLSLVRKEKDE